MDVGPGSPSPRVVGGDNPRQGRGNRPPGPPILTRTPPLPLGPGACPRGPGRNAFRHVAERHVSLDGGPAGKDELPAGRPRDRLHEGDHAADLSSCGFVGELALDRGERFLPASFAEVGSGLSNLLVELLQLRGPAPVGQPVDHRLLAGDKPARETRVG